MGPAASVGRLGDFADRLADQVGDGERDLGAAKVDANGQGGVAGEVVADRGPADRALGDSDRANPAFGFELGDHDRDRLLGQARCARERGPRQGRPVQQDLRDQAARILLRKGGGVFCHFSSVCERTNQCGSAPSSPIVPATASYSAAEMAAGTEKDDRTQRGGALEHHPP